MEIDKLLEPTPEQLKRFQAYIYGLTGYKLGPWDTASIWIAIHTIACGTDRVNYAEDANVRNRLTNQIIEIFQKVHGDQICKLVSCVT